MFEKFKDPLESLCVLVLDAELPCAVAFHARFDVALYGPVVDAVVHLPLVDGSLNVGVVGNEVIGVVAVESPFPGLPLDAVCGFGERSECSGNHDQIPFSPDATVGCLDSHVPVVFVVD